MRLLGTGHYLRGMGGGGYKMGKLRVRNFLRPPPPPQDRIKVYAPHPLLKFGNFLHTHLIQYG